MKKFYHTLLATLLTSILNVSFAQTVTPPIPPAAHAPTSRIAGYIGLVHPIVTFTKDDSHFNFDGSYTVGMPLGINIWKTQKNGFSLEIVPFIKAENGISKVNNLLIHPGFLAVLGKGYTFVGRVAFETSGRYGITPVFNKVIKKNKYTNYYVAVPLPLRFGNDRSTSFTAAFQFGVGF
jgi:hypothetical protein